MNVRNEKLAIHPPEPEPPVYLRTLGMLEAYVHRARVAWKGAGAGANQLKRSVSLLIARRDQPVSREVLIEVAHSRTLKGARNVISGIKHMLHEWGMGTALTIHDLSVTLRKHSSWSTDTDRLGWLLDTAEHCLLLHDHAGRLAALEAAEPLCGGRYLPIYDAVPEYSIDDEMAYWQMRQRDALQQLALVRLATNDGRLYAQAVRVAIRAIQFDPESAEAHQFVADIARRCGYEDVARRYELKAAQLMYDA